MTYDESLNHLHSRLEGVDDSEDRLQVWNKFIFEMIPENPDQAKRLCLETNEFTGILAEHPLGHADYLFNLGMIERSLSNYADALKSQMEALKIYEEIADKELIAMAMSEIGILLSDLNEYPGALEYLLKAQAIFQELDLKPNLHAILSALGSLYADSGDHGKAVETYQKSLDLLGSMDEEWVPTLRSYALNNLAAEHLEIKKYNRTIDLTREALDILQIKPDIRVEASLRINLGKALMGINRNTEAREEFNKSLVVADEFGSKRFVMAATAALGETHQAESDYETAQHCYEKALEISREIGRKSRTATYHQLLADVLKLQKKWEEACIHLEKGHHIREEIVNESAMKKLISLQVIHETQSLNDEIKKRKRIEQDLREKKEMFLMAFQVAKVGFGELNLETRKLHLDSTIKRLIGYDDDEIENDLEAFDSHLHPEDKDDVTNRVKSLVNGEISEVNHIHRMIHKDGSSVWLNARVKLLPDETGKRVRLVGIKTDITEQKILENSLKEHQERLVLRNEELKRLEHAVQCSGNAIVITDDKGNIEFANSRFEEMTGYSIKEVMGANPRVLKSGHHDDGFYKSLWKAVTLGESWKGEFRNKRKDGSLYWEQASISPVMDQAGKVTHFIAVKEDITERKEVEKKLKESLNEKEILLKEIHHRVKNNLAVVSGLLDLQAMSIPEEHIRFLFTECQNRIHSIALIHTKLYQSDNLGFIDFGEYLESLSSDLLSMYGNIGIGIEVECPGILVDLDTAIPLGLIVNELMTNAMKYAFPGNNSGTIRVVLDQKSDSLIELNISDNGIGLPEDFDFDSLESLGLQLVTSLTNQIDGTFSYHRDTGSRFEIIFPNKINQGTAE